jgi:hypothetical protein
MNKMSPELASGNVVITAEQFNPTIVSQIWLAKTGLVKEDEFAQGCIFADTVAQVRAREFELLVIPDRAQFVPTVEIERRQQVICEKLGLLVTRLPETPYRAMGFNLIWHVTPDQSSVEDFCRRLFLVPGSPVHRLFDVDDARFGSYLSKDSLGFRLKLTALPAVIETPAQERMLIVVFSFNYHFDVPEQSDRASSIVKMLGHWNDAVAESSQIVQAAQG